MNQPHVSITGLRFSYPDGTEAIRGVDIEIRHGERIGLAGENGSGKTTLCKHMNGLLSPSAGRILVDGRESSSLRASEIAAKVGYLFQNPDHQLFCSTVREEIEFGLRNIGLGADEIGRRVARYLEMLGIAPLAEQPPLALSLGLRRLVTVASVLAMEQELLILDEPIAWLDAKQKASVVRAIRQAGLEGRTTVVISHNMKLMAELTDRLIVMVGGSIKFDGRTKDIISDPTAMMSVGLVSPPVALLAESIKDALHFAGRIDTNEDFVRALKERMPGGGTRGTD
jgi:energy-coupling factor transport system ATP-binding protein